MNRAPIRLRLTLVFALAMAVVLAAVGAFVYLRLGASLLEQIDDRLEVRAASADPAAAGGEEEFAQVLGPDGAILSATPGLEREALLSRDDQRRARERRFFLEKDVGGEKARLLALPGEGSRVVVVGAALGDRDEALDGLLAQLLIGGPIALLLASAAGYLLAGAALRPVEAMRRRAGEISADTSAHRLPLPQARDEVFRLGETLNAMLERLDAGLRRERRFVADASHELRTPLALLQTELELALRRPRSPEELEHALGSAAEEVERLVRLAEDLLVLASTEDGRLLLRESEFGLRDLLDGVARRFEARTSAAGRALEVSAPPDATLTGDRIRLEQALGNLVDNALRHGTGTIRLEATAGNGSVSLRVGDGGAGFPPDFVPRAFERLSRADEARARGGAGLGLAIVDAIARAHDGEAVAANRAGGGAEITIVIPTR